MDHEEKKSQKFHLIGTRIVDGVCKAKIADEVALGSFTEINRLRRDFNNQQRIAEHGLRKEFNAATPVIKLRGGVHEYTREQVQEQIRKMQGLDTPENISAFKLALQRIDERLKKLAKAAPQAKMTN